MQSRFFPAGGLGLVFGAGGMFVLFLVGKALLSGAADPAFLAVMLLLAAATFFAAYRHTWTPYLEVLPGEVRFRHGILRVITVPKPRAVALVVKQAVSWKMNGVRIEGSTSWVPAHVPRSPAPLPSFVLDEGRTLWLPLGDLREADRVKAREALVAWAGELSEHASA